MTQRFDPAPVPDNSQPTPVLPMPAAAAGNSSSPPPPIPADAVPSEMITAPPPYIRLTFSQQPWVQELLPFLTSLVIHATILIIGIVIYGFFKASGPPAHEDQVIIPEAALAQEGPPGGVPNEGAGNNPLQQAMQDKDADAAEKSWAEKKGPRVDVTQLSGADNESVSVIGVGAAGGFAKGKGLIGDSSGTGESTGATAVFGAPGGGAMGPKGPVFGNGGNARTIIFVCDASGSMLTKWSALTSQISRTIHNDLRPIQSFNVIFFSGEGKPVVSFSKDAMAFASADNKLKFDQFIKKPFAAGDTDPIPGIEMALRQKPQLMYLLTDGEFPDNKGILAKINQLNKERFTKINTIAFTDQADAKNKADVPYKKFLKQVADENGGVFRDVNADDL